MMKRPARGDSDKPGTPMPHGTSGSKMLRWLWWLVPTLGVVEFLAQLGVSGRAPDEGEWAELAQEVSRVRQSGELVMVSPAWAEPNARHAFGDSIMPLADVARPDLERYARVLEVALLGQHQPALSEYRLIDQQRFGRFELLHWENPTPVSVVYDFVSHVEPGQLQVWQQSREDGTAGIPCDWTTRAKVTNGALFGHPTFPRERFRCEGGEWAFVGVTVIDDEHYQPRRCIWAHPSRDGLHLNYAHASLGDALVGYAGLPYFTSRDGRGTPVRLEVFVDGAVLGEYSHHDGEGWTRFAFDTTGFDEGEHEVEFRVSSARLARREFCFYAEARSPLSGDQP